MSPQFVVIRIGCLECSNESALLGAYATVEDARRAHPDAKLRADMDDHWDWHGDGLDVIFPLPPVSDRVPASALAEHDHLPGRES